MSRIIWVTTLKLNTTTQLRACAYTSSHVDARYHLKVSVYLLLAVLGAPSCLTIKFSNVKN